MIFKKTGYRMDITCSLMRLGGIALAAVGIAAACSGSRTIGIVLAVAGIMLAVSAFALHSARITEKLIKRIRDSGAEDDLKTSIPACITLYRANPGKKILKYISSLNPDAAREIRKMRGK